MTNYKPSEELLNIGVDGTCMLQEVYKNEMDKEWYAIVSIKARTDRTIKERRVAPDVKFHVPITEKAYQEMREALSKSKAESPVLRVRGDISVALGFESYA